MHVINQLNVSNVGNSQATWQTSNIAQWWAIFTSGDRW